MRISCRDIAIIRGDKQVSVPASVLFIGAKMEKLKIEKGIERSSTRLGTNSKYPFGDMEVEDSFFIAKEEAFSRNGYCKVFSAASYFGKRNGKKFMTRAVEGGFRVWRVE